MPRQKLKLAIVGSRDITDYDMFERYALGALKMMGFKIPDIGRVISGGARGADQIGLDFSIKNIIDLTLHIPQWKTAGKSDAFVRNGVIADQCDAAIVLWDGNSTGTQHTMECLDDNDKPYILIKVWVTYDGNGNVLYQIPYKIQFYRPSKWMTLYERTQNQEQEKAPGRTRTGVMPARREHAKASKRSSADRARGRSR